MLVNAGNANCATGEAGIEACRKTCVAAAETFGCIFDEVFPSSTGIIGVPFPAEKVSGGDAGGAGGAGLDAGACARRLRTAIMTTDTKMKVARAVIDVDGTGGADLWRGEGCGDDPSAAWGAGGSAARDDAGLPVYGRGGGTGATARRDGGAGGRELQQSISIDGDTSTNDTVLLLASGASGVKLGQSG